MSDLLDKLLEASPPIPFATGPAARGICYFLEEGGKVNLEKCREFFKSKAKYDAEFMEWAGYWQGVGEALRKEDNDEPV